MVAMFVGEQGRPMHQRKMGPLLFVLVVEVVLLEVPTEVQELAPMAVKAVKVQTTTRSSLGLQVMGPPLKPVQGSGRPVQTLSVSSRA